MAKQKAILTAGAINFPAMGSSIGSTYWQNPNTTAGPAVQWQATTSNATYCSASSALSIA